MPLPPPEKFIENIRLTLHARIPYHAALLRDMGHADVERELIDLAQMQGMDWPSAFSPPTYHMDRRRLCTLRDSLMAAAREDQQVIVGWNGG